MHVQFVFNAVLRLESHTYLFKTEANIHGITCILTHLCLIFDKTPFFAKTFGGEKCEASFAVSRTSFCLKERGDQALSNGGKDNPVRRSERWQIAVEN